MTVDLKDKLLGGLYGHLIGDAVGTPYEFKPPSKIPPMEQIDMIPPAGYDKSWREIPCGSWSDDGSQTLCLLEYYTEQKQDDVWSDVWAAKLLRWHFDGHLWVDNRSFDAGMQTCEVLGKIHRGIPPLEACPRTDPMLNGNGSLMRALPTALWFHNHIPNRQILTEAQNISTITHAHMRSQLCCAFYNAIALNLLTGSSFNTAIDVAEQVMTTPENGFDQGEWSVIKAGEKAALTGSGYVVNSLWTAIECIRSTNSYEQCIKRSIWYGKDTDTTACIAGGLAGILYGFSGIPQRWYDQLRGKHQMQHLHKALLERHGLPTIE